MVGSIIIIAVIAALLVVSANKKRQIRDYQLPAGSRKLLEDHVAFYRDLTDKDKVLFETRVRDFLANTTIRGVDTEVEDLDRLLIASGAIMLIFSFPDWRYNNISEILLYKGTFNKNYETMGAERNVLGMVGDGALHREMLLSKPSLRSSFQHAADGNNTVIHEFAHLIDKADGSVDGIPEYLLSRPQLLPWVKQMRDAITEMRANHYPDINIYGATNDAEFFAVITEYFFERPAELEEHHPELFSMLDKMFHPER